MVQVCLDRIAGVGVVSAVETLNELQRRRRNLPRWEKLKRRWEQQANELVRRWYLHRRQQLNDLVRRWEQLRKSGTAPNP
jgi:hypothetical protein